MKKQFAIKNEAALGIKSKYDLKKDQLLHVHPIMLIIMMVALVIFCISLSFRETSSPDIGTHLNLGRYITDNKTIPDKDLFTYTFQNNTYLNLSWLFQTIHWFLYALIGPVSIPVLLFVFTMVLWALLLYRSYLYHKEFHPLSILVLIIFAFGSTWDPRPQNVSLIFLCIIFLVFELYQKGNKRLLWALPIVMVLWVNVHSLFIVGLITIGLFFCIRFVQNKFTLSKNEIIIGLVSIAVCIINPYGPDGFFLPLKQYQQLSANSIFKSAVYGIQELQSPFRFDNYIQYGKLILHQSLFYQHVLLLLSVIGIISTRKSHSLFQWFIVCVFLYLFSQAIRNYGFFAVALFPIISSGCSKYFDVLTGDRIRKPKMYTLTLLTTCFFLLLLSVGSFSGLFLSWESTGIKPGYTFSKEMLPVRACKFIIDNNIKGLIINSWDQGSYIAFTTKQPIFIDSRGELSSEDFYKNYIQMKNGKNLGSMLETYKPGIAIVPYSRIPAWADYFNRHRYWRCVYVDDADAVYLHASIPDSVPTVSLPVAGKDYPFIDNNQLPEMLSTISKKPTWTFLSLLQGHTVYPFSLYRLSTFHLITGNADASIGYALDGLQKCPVIFPDLLLNCGHALNSKGMFNEADICFNKYLAISEPDSPYRSGIYKVRQTRGRSSTGT